MSSGNPFENPYAAPQAGKPSMAPAPQKLPGAFMTIAVVGIVFGVIGLLQGCCGVAFTLGTDQFIGFMAEATKQAPEEDRLQFDLMQAGLEATRKNLPMVLAVLVLGLICSGVMTIGGILGTMKRRAGVTWLIAACAIAMLLRVVGPIVETINAQAMAAAQESFLSSAPGIEPQQLEIAKNAQQIQGVVQIVMTIATSVVMFVLYGVALWYLVSSRRLREYFSGT